MSDQETPEVIDTTNVSQGDELTSLKATADKIGLRYHPSIGLDKLRIKVHNALSENPIPEDQLGLEEDEDEDSTELTAEELAAEQEAPVVSSIPKPTEQAAAVAPVAPVVPEAKEETPVTAPQRPLTPQEKLNAERDAARAEALKLVRINVTCMNPLKKEMTGEIITVGNGLIGTISKFVQFDTTEGWHVPQIILNVLKERQFQQFAAKKVPKGQPSSRVTKLVREFAIEILDPLTEKELADLKQRQLMAKQAQE